MNTFLALVDQQPAFWRAVIYLAAALATANALAVCFALVELFLGPLHVRVIIRPLSFERRHGTTTPALRTGTDR